MVEIDKEYLTRKHRGGENSKKGNMFEAYFSVYQILLLMSEGKLDATLFSQVENAYVDDLLILQDDSSVYHQIKDVKSLHGAILRQRILWLMIFTTKLSYVCFER